MSWDWLSLLWSFFLLSKKHKGTSSRRQQRSIKYSVVKFSWPYAAALCCEKWSHWDQKRHSVGLHHSRHSKIQHSSLLIGNKPKNISQGQTELSMKQRRNEETDGWDLPLVDEHRQTWQPVLLERICWLTNFTSINQPGQAKKFILVFSARFLDAWCHLQLQTKWEKQNLNGPKSSNTQPNQSMKWNTGANDNQINEKPYKLSKTQEPIQNREKTDHL